MFFFTENDNFVVLRPFILHFKLLALPAPKAVCESVSAFAYTYQSAIDACKFHIEQLRENFCCARLQHRCKAYVRYTGAAVISPERCKYSH